jgi:RecA-family ATPase
MHFAVMADTIGNGLENQIEDFYNNHSDLKVIIIDTLQKVRNETESGYGKDYKEMSILKELADKLRIAVVLIHHTRKCKDSELLFPTMPPHNSCGHMVSVSAR